MTGTAAIADILRPAFSRRETSVMVIAGTVTREKEPLICATTTEGRTLIDTGGSSTSSIGTFYVPGLFLERKKIIKTEIELTGLE